MREELLQRLQQYFELGGMWNPELADHAAVSDLLRDCRNYILLISPNFPFDSQLEDKT